MHSRFVIFCCFIAPVTCAQAVWSLQSLRPLTQYYGSTALSSNGDVYIAGGPTGWHWQQPTNSIGDTSSKETLVSKFDASGNPLYVTAIGGASGTLLAAAGNLYLYGTADAKAFATTPGAFNAGANLEFGSFVCKLRAGDGSILFCSLFVKAIVGLTADAMGNAYFSAWGVTPPSVAPTQGALALGTRSVQVTKLDPVGAIVYVAEFSGPQGHGSPTSVAADAQGNVWVAGHADADFPTTPNALLPSAPQSGAGFLAELNPSGTALLYSTFTDGSGQNAQIALDGAGNVYETDGTLLGSAILRKYSPGGAAILYRQDFANSMLAGLPFAVDEAGNVTALGTTRSVNFLTYHPIDACAPIGPFTNPASWVLIRVDASGKLIQSTFLSIPVSLLTTAIPHPQIAPNGYFLIASMAPYQLEIGQLGPAASPPINLSCAGNAASLTLAALAPGEIVSLFGNGLGPAAPVSAPLANNRLPFNLGGSQVTFNGIPAPLLYASDSQINAIVPWEIQSSGGVYAASTANVCVVYQSNATNCITMNVANAAPGIFQLPSGYAAVVNQDGTINGPQNPAAIGSVVSLYVTGLGPLSPTPADGSIVGLPLPTLTSGVKVLFHTEYPHPPVVGVVLYAGAAPLEVAGLYQINVLLIQAFSFPPPIPPATVEIDVDLPGGGFFATANALAAGPKISIQGIDVVK